jgi:hypothetical protein
VCLLVVKSCLARDSLYPNEEKRARRQAFSRGCHFLGGGGGWGWILFSQNKTVVVMECVRTHTRKTMPAHLGYGIQFIKKPGNSQSCKLTPISVMFTLRFRRTHLGELQIWNGRTWYHMNQQKSGFFFWGIFLRNFWVGERVPKIDVWTSLTEFYYFRNCERPTTKSWKFNQTNGSSSACAVLIIFFAVFGLNHMHTQEQISGTATAQEMAG